MADKVKTVNKTKLSNGEIRYYEDTFAREAIASLNEQVDDVSAILDTKQDTLIPGNNVEIHDNVISVNTVSDYNSLSNLPSINGKIIEGDNTPSELGLQEDIGLTGTLQAGDGIQIDVDSEGNSIISNTNVSAEWGLVTGDITDQQDLIDYISEYGGKIDTLSVNGELQPIIDKNVDIEVPVFRVDENLHILYISTTVTSEG